jgi:hypothetical protein
MAFTDLLNNTCTYNPNTTTNKYGDLAFGSGTTLNCRYAKNGKGLNQFNEGVISQKSAELWIDTTITPEIDDKILFGSIVYVVKLIHEFREGDGDLLGYKLIIDEYV